MSRREDTGWANPRVLAVFAVIFFCGTTFGSLLTRQYLHSRAWGWHTRNTIEDARHLGLERLKQELNLSPHQVSIVMKELDDYAKFYQNIEDERADVADQGRQRILDILDENQRRKFNQIFNRPTKH